MSNRERWDAARRINAVMRKLRSEEPEPVLIPYDGVDSTDAAAALVASLQALHVEVPGRLWRAIRRDLRRRGGRAA